MESLRRGVGQPRKKTVFIWKKTYYHKQWPSRLRSGINAACPSHNWCRGRRLSLCRGSAGFQCWSTVVPTLTYRKAIFGFCHTWKSDAVSQFITKVYLRDLHTGNWAILSQCPPPSGSLGKAYILCLLWLSLRLSHALKCVKSDFVPIIVNRPKTTIDILLHYGVYFSCCCVASSLFDRVWS